MKRGTSSVIGKDSQLARIIYKRQIRPEVLGTVNRIGNIYLYYNIIIAAADFICIQLKYIQAWQ